MYILPSALREKSRGKGGVLKQTWFILAHPQQESPFTIINKGYSYKHKPLTKALINTIITIINVLIVSIIANWCLFQSMFRQHGTQCNSQCNTAHQKHAFNSMKIEEITIKKGIATITHMYKHWPLLLWPVLV